MHVRHSSESRPTSECCGVTRSKHRQTAMAAVIGLFAGLLGASTGDLVWGLVFRSARLDLTRNVLLIAAGWACTIWLCVRARTKWQRERRSKQQ